MRCRGPAAADGRAAGFLRLEKFPGVTMSRVNPPGRVSVRPQPNVYTALALIGLLATLVALIYVLINYRTMIGF